MGRITLIDLDHVAESNVNRQVHATSDTIGQAKVLAMRDRIVSIHPACVVTCVEEFAGPSNWPDLLDIAPDAVIDACDQVKAKVVLAAWARAGKWGFITVGAAGGKRQAHRVDIGDLSQVTHDPLLAQLRYRLRREHGATRDGRALGVNCVFSREAVKPPDVSCAAGNDGSLNCHGFGSVVSVTATFGLCAAGWVIEYLADQATSNMKRAL